METRIIFLGAGASIPFFNPRLTTNYITQEIQDLPKWQNLVNRYSAIMRNTNMVNVQEVMNVLQRILHANPNLNFEQIIEIYDKISSFNFDPIVRNKIFNSILNYYHALPDNIHGHAWDNVPFLFRQLICETIRNLYDNCRSATYTTLMNQQNQFFNLILNDARVNIFSLNYDEIIYDSTAGTNFTNGFINQRFDVATYLNSNQVLSFPHGHIRFSFDDSGILYTLSGALANSNRLTNVGRNDRLATRYLIDSPYCYTFNTFIVTGQQKEPTFDTNPYAVYYQRFASDTLLAAKIYVIGYSFSDAHFNRMLLNFLRLDPRNKIFIVDYIPNPLDAKQDFMDPSSLVYKIFRALNITSLPMDNHLMYQYDADIVIINATGFGVLYPQVYLYKMGYDSFLSQYQNLPII
jgi:hypothetical protein